ncbi:MAG: hypothetical protein L6R36_000866 [Xanthoria steineri]|nr:MAG: hypothetical protein L6R36_000866 [Xanthoria steineri]
MPPTLSLLDLADGIRDHILAGTFDSTVFNSLLQPHAEIFLLRPLNPSIQSFSGSDLVSYNRNVRPSKTSEHFSGYPVQNIDPSLLADHSTYQLQNIDPALLVDNSTYQLQNIRDQSFHLTYPDPQSSVSGLESSAEKKRRRTPSSGADLLSTGERSRRPFGLSYLDPPSSFSGRETVVNKRRRLTPGHGAGLLRTAGPQDCLDPGFPMGPTPEEFLYDCPAPLNLSQSSTSAFNEMMQQAPEQKKAGAARAAEASQRPPMTVPSSQEALSEPPQDPRQATSGSTNRHDLAENADLREQEKERESRHDLAENADLREQEKEGESRHDLAENADLREKEKDK